MLSRLALVIKAICYLAIAGLVGCILGDEFQQRKLRADLRSLCYEQMLERMGGEANELQDAVIQYQCRNSIP